ncbi:MAG: beta-ketoacyl-[acyl-carrier-protein] synthase family protein, partial [Planctomycetales bacterium]|nr:beta-ketoacyl-[acyl-carrier-protein] synthase family protein [Planctomycetales bacterium]
MTRRRVVVTGMGVINPLGHDVETVWNALLNGQSGVDYTTLFDASRFPTRISAEVKPWDISQHVDDPELWNRRGRHSRFAIGAAVQAMRQSGALQTAIDPTRFGIYLGAGEGTQDFESFSQMMMAALQDGEFDIRQFTRKGLEVLDPLVELEQEPSMPAGHLAAYFNAQGPNANCLTACAASSQAIGEATEIIRRGEADVMLSGGTHSMIHPLGVTGFNLLTALSTRNEEPTKASRPFDRLRDGFVLGEGAGMLVLEELERAKARGAMILGEILGYGSTADAYRITDIHPEGRGAISCMRMAIDDAGLNPNSINYVNAHGTSTAVNDRVETVACHAVFGDDAPNVPVSST